MDTNSSRKNQIQQLIEFTGLEEYASEILKKIPEAEDDKSNEEFNLYYAFVQLLAMFSSADDNNKCDILSDVTLLNKRFKLDLDQLDYYTRICRG